MHFNSGQSRLLKAVWWRHDELITAIMCLLPAMVIFGLFNIFPILYSDYLSLLKWDGLSDTPIFVGSANYIALFQSDSFWNSIRVTLYYMGGVTLLGLGAGLLIALALNQGVRWSGFYRTVYFTPVITSTVAAAVVWKYLFNPGSGYINEFLHSIGILAPNWLTSPVWAMPAVILVGMWKRLGFNMVIYLAGLQAVPPELYAAAKVDGAGAWARFWYITLPQLRPVTLLLVIMSVIDSFLVFDQIYIMTGGGPLETTNVIGFMLYQHAFRYFSVGSASAIGWVMFTIIFAITLLQWTISRHTEEAS